MLESIQSGFDFAKGKQITDKKTRAKYVIFLAAFVFEDIGQVLIQEIYHPFIHLKSSPLLIKLKYLYYEQFGTRKSLFSLANAFSMILISAIPTLIMVFKYELTKQQSVGRKLIFILLFGFPTFLLYLLRFFKGLVLNSRTFA